MEKSLKRQIGYKRPTPAAPVSKPKAASTSIEKENEIAQGPPPQSHTKGSVSVKDLVEGFASELQKQKKEYDAKLEALAAKNEKLRGDVQLLKDGPNNEPATAQEVISWINSHPMFKYSVMCDEIGIDKARFCRTLQSKNAVIKPEIVAKIEAVIKRYGFRA